MIYTIFPCPISFFPLDSFCPPPYIILPSENCLMIYTIYPCPISSPPWINFPPISFCPHTILPPGNCLMINTIYTIYPCPISFFPLDSFCPSYHFAPMERNCLMIYTIYTCPVSFCLLDTFWHPLQKKSLRQAHIRWLWHLWFILK